MQAGDRKDAAGRWVTGSRRDRSGPAGPALAPVAHQSPGQSPAGRARRGLVDPSGGPCRHVAPVAAGCRRAGPAGGRRTGRRRSSSRPSGTRGGAGCPARRWAAGRRRPRQATGEAAGGCPRQQPRDRRWQPPRAVAGAKGPRRFASRPVAGPDRSSVGARFREFSVVRRVMAGLDRRRPNGRVARVALMMPDVGAAWRPSCGIAPPATPAP